MVNNTIFLQSPPPKLEDLQKTIFNNATVNFMIELHRKFDGKVEQLYKNRLHRPNKIQPEIPLDFMKSSERNDKSWCIAALPARLQNRHVDLGNVSPSNAAHMIAALNADVQGVHLDFDDGHCPTWKNQLHAYHNINLLVNGKLPGAPFNLRTCPILIFRLRSWDMIEHNILIDGKECIGPLVDFAVLMKHNAIKLFEANSGPYFYLSKIENAKEASLWNEIFVWAQKHLDIPHQTIKACIGIDNILSIFELDEILFVLRDHTLGFDFRVWNCCASIIAKLGDQEQFLLPDRDEFVNMDGFLHRFLQLVVNTCYKRGASATAGMVTTTLPPGSDLTDKQSKAIISKILEAKVKDIEEGMDGFIIYDLRMIPHINELWKKYGRPSFKESIRTETVSAQELMVIPRGKVTLRGLRRNVAISILFIYHWLAEVGHFFYDGHVEDAGTADLARWQVWQWIRFAPPLDDDDEDRVTMRLVERVASRFAQHAHKHVCRSSAERKRLSAARHMSLELFVARRPPPTLAAYLNDNHKFRTIHNKAILSNI